MEIAWFDQHKHNPMQSYCNQPRRGNDSRVRYLYVFFFFLFLSPQPLLHNAAVRDHITRANSPVLRQTLIRTKSPGKLYFKNFVRFITFFSP